MRSPLILWCGRSAGEDLLQSGPVTSLTEHVDIAPTILDLLGIKPDWGIHGESLLPIATGRRRKEAVFADGGHEAGMRGRFSFKPEGRDGTPKKLNGKQLTYQQCPDSMARTKMVRTERWKLVIRETGGNELYDMQADPWELNNLWNDYPSNPILRDAVLDLQQKMIEWCLRTDTDRPYQEQVGA
ncbi:hypothetical protein GX586_15035 [bacterium]|nr:hypothetical protein [bacterium]